MRIHTILLAAVFAVTPAFAQQTPAPQEQEMTGEGGPEEDVMETIPAIVSKIPANEARNPWRGAGTMTVGKGRRTAPALKVDYDRDGIVDTARLVQSRVHAAVLLTSGKTGRTRPIWLTNSKGLGSDVNIQKGDNGHIEIIFPESTVIFLFDDHGKPMATYQNG